MFLIFLGPNNLEEYIDWEKNLERYFDYKETPIDQCFKIAKVKLSKLATVWLEGLQRQRKREERTKIDS